jgi:hypothetical protein
MLIFAEEAMSMLRFVSLSIFWVITATAVLLAEFGLYPIWATVLTVAVTGFMNGYIALILARVFLGIGAVYGSGGDNEGGAGDGFSNHHEDAH